MQWSEILRVDQLKQYKKERILGKDKNPEGENNTSDILQIVDKLKDQLDQFEKMRVGIKDSIESAAKMIPNLEEEKEQLREDLREKQGKIGQIENLIPKLEKEKQKLQEDMEQKQEQISQIDEQLRLIQRARNYEV